MNMNFVVAKQQEKLLFWLYKVQFQSLHFLLTVINFNFKTFDVFL